MFSRSVSQFSARRREGGTALHTHPLAGKFVSGHTRGYKLLPPKRWIDFLPIPYQAEREKRALCNRILY